MLEELGSGRCAAECSDALDAARSEVMDVEEALNKDDLPLPSLEDLVCPIWRKACSRGPLEVQVFARRGLIFE